MLRASRNPSDPIHSPTQPTDVFVGMLWVDTDASPATLYICTSISPVTFEVVGPATVASPLTTKGDIWGYSNANSRIPVGSDAKSLVADSTAALGVAWATRVPEAPTDGTAYVRQSAAWVAQAGTGGSGGTSGNFLVTGGGVAWSTGLSLIVSAASYVIQGTAYTSAITTLTLSTADATNPRIDVIALNTSGAAVIIAGTPAATPEKPDVNPVTQLEISFVYVPAGATVPNVTVTQIYFENVEWTTTRSGTSFTLASTNNPYAGTKDVEGTAVPTGDYVNFEAPSTFDPNTYDKLVLYIRSKATWDSTRALNLTFRNNGGAQKGVIIALRHGSYGFDSSITSAYQQIVIPVVDFGAGGISCKMLRATMGGTGTAPGMYLDNIQFQTGLAPSAANLDMRWRGDYSSTTAYSTNDAVQYQGVLWVATNNGTGNTPSTSSTFWQDATGPETSAGLSVTGRSANTTGTVADITAANDAEVLRRSGTSIGFGTVATAGIADDAVTYAKMQNVAGFSIPAKATTGSGDLADLTAGNDTVLGKQGSGNLAFTTIAAAQIASDAVTTAKILDANVTYAKLQNVAGLSVVGRSANSSGVPAAITGATIGHVMQILSGTTVGFGAVPSAGSVGVIDPAHRHDYITDFIGGSLEAGWQTGSGALGATGTVGNGAMATDAFGTVVAGTGTTASSFAFYGLGAAMGTSHECYVNDSVALEIEFRLKSSDAATTTHQYTAQAGLIKLIGGGGSQFGVTAGNKWDTGSSADRFFVRFTSAGVATDAIASSGPTAGQYYHYRIVCTTTSAVLYVDGVSVATVSSGLPTGGVLGRPYFGISKQAGSGVQRTCTIDLIHVHKDWSSARY